MAVSQVERVVPDSGAGSEDVEVSAPATLKTADIFADSIIF